MIFPLLSNDKVEPGGGHQGEKNFFAVLDVSEHLEAKKDKDRGATKLVSENKIFFDFIFYSENEEKRQISA